MPKACEKCSNSFTGWGPVCAECRKNGSKNPVAPSPRSTDQTCQTCQKTVYPMEKIEIEGMVFHNTCFRCKHCNTKLNVGKFSRAPSGDFFCPTHYKELFRLKGTYDIDGADLKEVGNTEHSAQARASAVPTEEVVRKSESAASGTVKSLAARTTNTTNNGGQPQKPFGTSEDEPDKKRRKTPEKETLLKNVGRDFADPPPVPSDVQKDGEHGRVETNEREEESSAEVLGASACLVEEGVVSEEKEEVVAADVEEPKNVLIERTMLVEEPDKTVLVEDPKNVLVEDLVVEKTEIQDPFENDSSSGNGSAGAEGAPSLSPLKVRRSPQPASIRGEVEPAAHTQDADKMELVTPAETPATHTHAVGHGDLPSDGSHAASSAEVTVTAEPILLDRGRRGTDVPEAPLSETTRMSEAQQRLVAPPHSGGPAEEDAAMTNNNAGGEAEQNPAAQKPHKNFDEAPPESCPGADQAACTGDEHDIPITDADGDIEMSQEEADEDGAEGLIQKEGGEGEREEDVDVAMAVDHHP